MIILAGTPLGNDADASPRLKQALAAADLIAAEDTRRLLNLVRRLEVEIHAPVIAYHDHIEAVKAPELISAAEAGKNVVMVSDAGMPAISDPGFRLAALAAEAGIEFTVIPGPSAPVTALAISGIASDRFTFEGFLPRKDGERKQALESLVDEQRTMIFFESPRRLEATLLAMANIFGTSRHGAVCRELTKVHEEVIRGDLSKLLKWAQSKEVLGEIVLVIAGAPAEANAAADFSALVPQVHELAALGLRLKDAAAYIAQKNGVRKNALFKAALAQE
ncbi:16S rRNA (cytidine(1402)-2'-O)-methyltransferase [Arcanobacterium hippocoleae]|uniref:Ribosomal RNA small subunit methyltransferase I n=1 Tax=Arcanobacterium hippocoleae TaxID=149017 RepID=A0ABU1T3F3_9ACTO|nr:16S rRNA (cytidine(1402)-2'-O)-methyltransferase [Arcanobacterium hippocoleae]MDR6939838.1 16S rRNA (cytidine1402-2'-O)-methyltransferase [Arcanobacterium hippocoleae]